MPENPGLIKKNIRGYALDQCALYKVGSKSRLGAIFDKSYKSLIPLCIHEGNYRVFKRPEEVCEYTKKKVKERWVQEPLGELKAAQARIQYLLSGIQLPAYCHGAAQGRSYRSNASFHKDAKVVATFDIKSFFPSTSSARVYNFFRDTLLCAPDVAELLTKLCCYEGVLPTGAPTSPVISFYANRALFDELSKLAEEYGLRFSVYLDDLTFSGDNVPRGLGNLVERIVSRHGHKLSVKKSKRFSAGVPKHITGVVVNAGSVAVPYVRFQKARGLMRAARIATTDLDKYLLTRRLAGLLGEAAYLDSRYKKWARRAYDDLSHLKEKLDKAGVAVPAKTGKRHTKLAAPKKSAPSARRTSSSARVEKMIDALPWV